MKHVSLKLSPKICQCGGRLYSKWETVPKSGLQLKSQLNNVLKYGFGVFHILLQLWYHMSAEQSTWYHNPAQEPRGKNKVMKCLVCLPLGKIGPQIWEPL